MTFRDDMTIREARALLRELLDEGVNCPCCGQFTKRYRRKLPNATCRVMIALYRRGEGREYLFLPDLLDQVQMKGTPHQGGYGTLAQFWGLMERQPGLRDDGSDRVGWWRLTDRGRPFVRGETTVPKYALLFDGQCHGLTGEPITIQQALGKKFNYRDLMEGL